MDKNRIVTRGATRLGLAVTVAVLGLTLTAGPAVAQSIPNSGVKLSDTETGFDINGDGKVDLVHVDKDNDGHVDEVERDVDFDGAFDELDIIVDNEIVGRYRKPGDDDYYQVYTHTENGRIEDHVDLDGVGDYFDSVAVYETGPDGERGVRLEDEFDLNNDGLFDQLDLYRPNGVTEYHRTTSNGDGYELRLVDTNGDNDFEEVWRDNDHDGLYDDALIKTADGTVVKAQLTGE